jgi:hypothetical protein
MGGVELTGPIGIDRLAHTGYSTTAELTLTFSQSRSLCGTNAPPGSTTTTPRRIVTGLP